MIYKIMPGVYKEPISAVVFLSGIGVIALFAPLTASFHIAKVAMRNPVEVLQNE